jgi:hypothetical protein
MRKTPRHDQSQPQQYSRRTREHASAAAHLRGRRPRLARPARPPLMRSSDLPTPTLPVERCRSSSGSLRSKRSRSWTCSFGGCPRSRGRRSSSGDENSRTPSWVLRPGVGRRSPAHHQRQMRTSAAESPTLRRQPVRIRCRGCTEHERNHEHPPEQHESQQRSADDHNSQRPEDAEVEVHVADVTTATPDADRSSARPGTISGR